MSAVCRAWLIAAALFARASAQTNTLDGEYHFVQLQIREGKTADVAAAAGTLQFAAGGLVKGQIRAAKGRAAMSPAAFQGKWAAKGSAFTLTNPLDTATGLEVRASQGVLVGASVVPGSHVFLVGVRAPSGAVAVAPRGRYKAAWFALPESSTSRMASGLIDLVFGESGAVSQAELLVHSAAFDDVTRKETLDGARFVLGAKGAGEFHAGTGSEWLQGKRELLASSDGSVVLGYWPGAGLRDVLVAVRPEAVPTSTSWAGSYWTTGLSAETPYELGARAPRIGSSFGTLKNDGAGTALIAERIFTDGRERHLHTVNAYRMGTDGSSMLGRQFSTTVNNFATGGVPAMFIAAQLGGAGELSLEHGISVGVKMSESIAPVETPVLLHLDGATVDGARPAKAGLQLELKVKPAGAVEVWIAAEPAEVKRSGDKILVTVPKIKLPGTLPVAVLAGDILYDLSTLYVVP